MNNISFFKYNLLALQKIFHCGLIHVLSCSDIKCGNSLVISGREFTILTALVLFKAKRLY